MNWSDIAGAVGKAAPILGTLLGGPAGAAIGGIVAASLGTAATPDAVQAAIATDPEAALKLATTESDNKVKLQGMLFAHAEALQADETHRIELSISDVQGARARDTEFLKSGQRNARADLMVLGVTVGLIACVGMLALYSADIPPGASALITTIASIFGLCLRDAFTFEFGSSRGSETKTQLLAKMTPAVEPNAANG